MDRELDDDRTARPLSRRQRDIAVIGWCSFLVAAVGSVVLFAWLDPAAVFSVSEPPLDLDRRTGYAVGFFFLWAVAAAAAALTVYLIRTRRGHPPPPE